MINEAGSWKGRGLLFTQSFHLLPSFLPTPHDPDLPGEENGSLPLPILG